MITLGLYSLHQSWLVAKKVHAVAQSIMEAPLEKTDLDRAKTIVQNIVEQSNPTFSFIKNHYSSALFYLNLKTSNEKSLSLNKNQMINSENVSQEIQKALELYKTPYPEENEVTVPVKSENGQVDMVPWHELSPLEQQNLVQANRKGSGKKLFGSYGAEKSWNWCKSEIPRWKHGCMHVVRASFAVRMIAELYKKYDPSISLHENDILLAQYLIIFHDSARQADGVDVWDDQSAEMAVPYLESLGFDEESIQKCVEAIKSKDEPIEKKSPLSRLIHEGDCLDILRVRRHSFDKSRLDCYTEITKKYPKNSHSFIKELDQLINEYGEFVDQTEKPLIKSYLENKSRNYFEDLLSLAKSTKNNRYRFPKLHELLGSHEENEPSPKLSLIFNSEQQPEFGNPCILKTLTGGIHRSYLQVDKNGKVVFIKEATEVGALAEIGCSQMANFLVDGLVPEAVAVDENKNSVQQPFIEMEKGIFSVEAMNEGHILFSELTQKQKEQLFAHMIADKAIANYDAHIGQFSIDSHENLIGFDKGQGFKLFEKKDFSRKGMPKRTESEQFDPSLKWNPDLPSVYEQFTQYLKEHPDQLAAIFTSTIVQQTFDRCASIELEQLEQWLMPYAEKANLEKDFFEKIQVRLKNMSAIFGGYFQMDLVNGRVMKAIKDPYVEEIEKNDALQFYSSIVEKFDIFQKGGQKMNWSPDQIIEIADCLIKLKEKSSLGQIDSEEILTTAAKLYQEAILAQGYASNELIERLQSSLSLADNHPLSSIDENSISNDVNNPTFVSLSSISLKEGMIRIAKTEGGYNVEFSLEDSLRRRLNSMTGFDGGSYFRFGELQDPSDKRRSARVLRKGDLKSHRFETSCGTVDIGKLEKNYDLYNLVRINISDQDDASGLPQDLSNKIHRALIHIGLPALVMKPTQQDIWEYKKLSAIQATYPQKLIYPKNSEGMNKVLESLTEKQKEKVEKVFDSLELKEVFPGFYDYVSPLVAKQTWDAGGRGFGTSISLGTPEKTAEVFVNILKTGLLSQQERLQRGDLKGITASPIQKGASNGVFFRQLVKAQYDRELPLSKFAYGNEGIMLLCKQSLAERTPIAYNEHFWGCDNPQYSRSGLSLKGEAIKPGAGHTKKIFTGISGEDFIKARKSPKKLVKIQQKKYLDNLPFSWEQEYSEAIFKRCVAPESFYKMIVPSEEYKNIVIEELNKNQISNINGIDLEKFIHVGNSLSPELMESEDSIHNQVQDLGI